MMDHSSLTNLSYISKGSFALVYAAHLESTGTRVAVKVLKPEHHSDADGHCKRFLKEVAIQASLRHKNLVSMHGLCTVPVSMLLPVTPLGILPTSLTSSCAPSSSRFSSAHGGWGAASHAGGAASPTVQGSRMGAGGGMPVQGMGAAAHPLTGPHSGQLCWAAVMEIMTDGTLYDLLQVETKHPNSPLGLYGLADAIQWLVEVANAMSYLHSRQPMLIHRDLKLENIMLARDSSGSAAKGGAGTARTPPGPTGKQTESYVAKIGDVGLLVAVDTVTGKKVGTETFGKPLQPPQPQKAQQQQQQQQQQLAPPSSWQSHTDRLSPAPLSPLSPLSASDIPLNHPFNPFLSPASSGLPPLPSTSPPPFISPQQFQQMGSPYYPSPSISSPQLPPPSFSSPQVPHSPLSQPADGRRSSRSMSQTPVSLSVAAIDNSSPAVRQGVNEQHPPAYHAGRRKRMSEGMGGVEGGLGSREQQDKERKERLSCPPQLQFEQQLQEQYERQQQRRQQRQQRQASQEPCVSPADVRRLSAPPLPQQQPNQRMPPAASASCSGAIMRSPRTQPHSPSIQSAASLSPQPGASPSLGSPSLSLPYPLTPGSNSSTATTSLAATNSLAAATPTSTAMPTPHTATFTQHTPASPSPSAFAMLAPGSSTSTASTAATPTPSAYSPTPASVARTPSAVTPPPVSATHTPTAPLSNSHLANPTAAHFNDTHLSTHSTHNSDAASSSSQLTQALPISTPNSNATTPTSSPLTPLAALPTFTPSPLPTRTSCPSPQSPYNTHSPPPLYELPPQTNSASPDQGRLPAGLLRQRLSHPGESTPVAKPRKHSAQPHHFDTSHSPQQLAGRHSLPHPHPQSNVSSQELPPALFHSRPPSPYEPSGLLASAEHLHPYQADHVSDHDSSHLHGVSEAGSQEHHAQGQQQLPHEHQQQHHSPPRTSHSSSPLSPVMEHPAQLHTPSCSPPHKALPSPSAHTPTHHQLSPSQQQQQQQEQQQQQPLTPSTHPTTPLHTLSSPVTPPSHPLIHSPTPLTPHYSPPSHPLPDSPTPLTPHPFSPSHPLPHSHHKQRSNLHHTHDSHHKHSSHDSHHSPHSHLRTSTSARHGIDGRPSTSSVTPAKSVQASPTPSITAGGRSVLSSPIPMPASARASHDSQHSNVSAPRRALDLSPIGDVPPAPPSPPLPPNAAPPPPTLTTRHSGPHSSQQQASPAFSPTAVGLNADYLPSATDNRYNLTGRCGSVLYMAPEVARGKPYNEKVDVFSFAILAWELLGRCLLSSGLPAGDPEAMLNHVAKVAWQGWRPSLPAYWPAELKLLISLCWHEDPRLRPSFATIHAKLRAMQQSGDVTLLVATEAPLLGSAHHPANRQHTHPSSGSGTSSASSSTTATTKQTNKASSQQAAAPVEKRGFFSKLLPGKNRQQQPTPSPPQPQLKQQQQKQPLPAHEVQQQVRSQLVEHLERTKREMQEQLSSKKGEAHNKENGHKK